MSTVRIPEQVLGVLSECVPMGNVLQLPPRQLDRKDYESVAKIVGLMGGKWDRRAKGMVFAGDAADALDAALVAGEVVDQKKALGFFETPRDVVDRLIRMADLEPEMRVLEPSAGRGAIALPLAIDEDCDVVCCEIEPTRCCHLREQGLYVHQGDFLELPITTLFDRVLMNPPFAKQADIDHVWRAFDHLKPGGKLISVMGAGVAFRNDAKARTFREWLGSLGGAIARLPEGSFKASGTGVNAIIATANKGGAK